MRYMTANELAVLMKESDKVAQKDYVVIDVRDDDRVGGHIKGSISQPSLEFTKNVDQLVSKTKDVPLVIFHCALSQQRGPKAAGIYEKTRQQNIENGITHEVVVLRHGFSGFQIKYKDDPDLVEAWEASYWKEDWIDDDE